MNGCIDEFECNTRICMLHSIWCIMYIFIYIEKLWSLLLPHFAVKLYSAPESVKNNKFYITTKHNTRTTFSNYFYHHHTHHKLAQQLLNLIHIHHLWCIVPHQHSRQRSFKHHEQHNKNNTEQNNLHHSLSINTQ